ncbi:MAG: NUDIX domain-containing protein [Candidatus Portnoybacteria bacterium]|nr:NUDIX domain-containing protein [Candidatus Portnoybacteria bacterium]MDD4983023.1 NUDIX domain-containing protein [Candidatus Portnoybacteria bacterium]
MPREQKTHENISISLIWDVWDRLLLLFNEKHGLWMLPGGHSEPEKGENITAAANRENLEETTLSDIEGYRSLFYLEDTKEGRPRVFFVHEGFYLKKDPQDIKLPKKLLKKEHIREAKWFSLEKLEDLPLSPIAKKAIDMALPLLDRRKDINSNRARNYLQKILSQAQKSINNPNKLKQIDRTIKKLGGLMGGLDKEGGGPAINSPDISENNHEKKDLVIIVDDDRSISSLTKEFLENFYRVFTFDNPTDALKYLEKLPEESIKAILVDFYFPAEANGKTGVDFIKNVNNLYPGIKTILFTGDILEAQKHTGLCLQKPTSFEEILGAIKGNGKTKI